MKDFVVKAGEISKRIKAKNMESALSKAAVVLRRNYEGKNSEIEAVVIDIATRERECVSIRYVERCK